MTWIPNFLVSAVLGQADMTAGARFSLNGDGAAMERAYRAATARADLLAVPRHWPDQLDLVQWCSRVGPGLAALMVVAGVIYLLFGYKIFKPLVVLNAAVAGGIIGALAGQKIGPVIPFAIVGAVLAAAVTWPTMKYAVAVMGGILGALMGATIWHGVGLDPRFAWSGAAIGLCVGGLLCFILFRGCVMMYTSLQGACMLTFGVLALLLKYQDLSPHVGNYLAVKPFLLPLCVFIPAVIGLMYQQHVGALVPAKPPGGPPKK